MREFEIGFLDALKLVKKIVDVEVQEEIQQMIDNIEEIRLKEIALGLAC